MYDRGEGAFLQDSLTAFVLAGGKSTRMGTDKAFVEFGGCTLLARALQVTRSVTCDVRIVGEASKFAAFGPVVEDVFRNCGPLGGIHAALQASTAELNLMLAVDLPLVTAALLELLVSRAQNSTSAIVTVPCAGGYWQPLCAVYRREFEAPAESALRAGRYKIDALFETVKVQAIAEKEMADAGFSAGTFRNVNTREDLESAAAEALK